MNQLHLVLGVAIAALFSVSTAQIAGAETTIKHKDLRLRDFNRPAITVKDWLAQVEAATVQVTGVTLERTEAGLDITLETQDGKPLQVDATKFRSEGNSLIADIPNAVLAIPAAQAFSADNPTEEISNVQVTQLDAANIRVSVTGKDALPTGEVTLKTGALAYSLNPEADEPDEEIVVTGAGQRGYRVPNSSVGTRTDTPLRDIPQSIQVVPKQVLQEQGATSFQDVLRNVPGVSQGTVSSRGFFNNVIVRGFAIRNTLRDGIFDDSSRILGYDPALVDQVEVLKGPASVLYGQGGLGGTINYITKQPLDKPFYEVEGTIGNYDFYRGAVDLSGPLNDEKTVLYRLNLAAQTNNSFIDFQNVQRYVVSPKLTWLISDRTKLTFKLEYIDEKRSLFDQGVPLIGSILPNPNGQIPRNRFLGDIDGKSNSSVFRVGYDFEHRFDENWQFKNAFLAGFIRLDSNNTFPTALRSDNRTLNRSGSLQDFRDDDYSLDTYVVGKFATGSIQHQLITGIALSRISSNTLDSTSTALPLDIYNPIYRQPRGAYTATNRLFRGDALGIYIQDQMSLLDNLKFLIGGRLLREGTMTIAEVANRVGYAHLGCFAAVFKQQFGIAPSECLAGKRSCQ